MTTVFCGQVGCWSPRAVEKLADCPVEDEVVKRKDVSRDGVVIAFGLGFVVFESVFVYKLPPQFSPHASFAVIVKAGKGASLKDLFTMLNISPGLLYDEVNPLLALRLRR